MATAGARSGYDNRRPIAGRVRLGLIGLGPRGMQDWIPMTQIVDGAELVGVCDRLDIRRLEGAAQAGLPTQHAHRDASELLARSDVDAIVVCVAPELQPQLIVDALEAGKHVICDVPLGYTIEDCWRVVLAVERSGLTFALAEQLSFTPSILEWRRMYHRGDLGKILYGEAQYVHDIHPDWYWMDGETGRYLSWEEARSHPNATKTRFWDLRHPIWYNPHSLCPLLRVLDERVVTVSCMSTRRQSYFREEVPLPDFEVALMHTEGDSILRVASGYVTPAPSPSHWLHLWGTKAEVETGRRATPPASALSEEGLHWRADQHMFTRQPMSWSFTGRERGAAQTPKFGWVGVDHHPLYDFVESILEGRPPVLDVYRAAGVAGAAATAGTSAENGGSALPVPDFRPGPARKAGEAPAEAH